MEAKKGDAHLNSLARRRIYISPKAIAPPSMIAVGVEGFQDQAIKTVTQCRRLQFTVASVRPPITKTTVSAKVDFVGWHLSSVIMLDCTGFDHFPLASSVDGFDSAHLIRRKGDDERTLFDFRQGERFR